MQHSTEAALDLRIYHELTEVSPPPSQSYETDRWRKPAKVLTTEKMILSGQCSSSVIIVRLVWYIYYIVSFPFFVATASGIYTSFIVSSMPPYFPNSTLSRIIKTHPSSPQSINAHIFPSISSGISSKEVPWHLASA